jgi:hypothetical protein
MYKLFACAALICAFSVAASAQVPDSLSFQGCLTNADGNPVDDGSYSVHFALYDHPTTGSPIWGEDQSVDTNDCVYEVHLGASTTLADIAFDKPLWLGINVQAEGEMTPRTPLTGAPYAFGLRNLRIVPADDGIYAGVNIIGGSHVNATAPNAVGATIAGGGGVHWAGTVDANSIAGQFGFIGGGVGNFTDYYGVIGGGWHNQVNGMYGTVGGGFQNKVWGQMATVFGGSDNTAGGDYSLAGGRRAKSRLADHGTFVWADHTDAGFESTGQDQFLVRAGGGVGLGTNAPAEQLDVNGAVKIGMNWSETDGIVRWNGTDFEGRKAGSWVSLTDTGIRAEPASDGTYTSINIIGGAESNTVTAGAVGATIAGGGTTTGMTTGHNQVQEDFGTIGGGAGNNVSHAGGVVAGGVSNTAAGINATVSGGSGHEAAGEGSSISGGEGNIASGNFSAVGGGYENEAWGNYSVAAGGIGNTAYGDYSFAAGRRSSVGASHHGSFVWADHTDAAFTSSGEDQFLVRASGGFGINTNAPAHPLQVGNGGDTYGNGAHVTGGGAWTNGSSRTFKTNLRPVRAEEVLDGVATLQLYRWEYIGSDEGDHMGPVAEDFSTAFQLGNDHRYISGVDGDGVALAAIQGLYQLVKEQQAEIESLRDRLDVLER